MKQGIITALSICILTIFTFSKCTGDQGPMGSVGPTGQTGNTGPSGNAPVYYSNWIKAKTWAGHDSSWTYTAYDTVLNARNIAIGIIIGYAMISKELSDTTFLPDSTVRPLPCFVNNAFWSYLIDTVNQIKFCTNFGRYPDTSSYFRYAVIHTSDSLALDKMTVNLDLHQMPYASFCQKYNIPK